MRQITVGRCTCSVTLRKRNFSFVRSTQDDIDNDGRESSVFLLVVSSPMILAILVELFRSDDKDAYDDDDPFGYREQRSENAKRD